MTDYELDKFCERNPDCGCNCMSCPAFASHMREELGLNDYDSDEYSSDTEEPNCDTEQSPNNKKITK